jgi:hypothetical protein
MSGIVSGYPPISPRLPIKPGSYQQQFPYYGAYPYIYFKENVEGVPRTIHPAYMVPGGPGARPTPGPISAVGGGRIYNDPQNSFFNLFLNTISSALWPQQSMILPDIRAYGFQYARANSRNFIPKYAPPQRHFNNRPTPPAPQPHVTFGTHYPWVVPQYLPGTWYR